MNRFRCIALFPALALCVSLAGCHGGGTTPAVQPPNLSGDYTGTLQDSKSGSGNATATLAQHGTSAGGAISAALSGGTLNAQITLAIGSSNAVSGAMVVDFTNGTTCTFGTTGSYNTGTNVLSGTYSAVTGCSGQSGTYTLTQQCLDTITGSRRRTMGLTQC